MFCGVFAIHTDVIMYGNDSRESISDLVHPHLKYIGTFLSLVQMVLVTTFYLQSIIAFSPLAATMYQYDVGLLCFTLISSCKW